MSPFSPRVTLFLILGLAFPGFALAGLPDPDRSGVPSFIRVVGMIDHGATPDPLGLATVTLRDFANNPRPNAHVVLDFSGCCDIVLCPVDIPGQTTDCVARTVSGLTNDDGQFTFVVVGAARDPGTMTPPAQYGGCGLNGVQVRADAEFGPGEMVLGTTTAACLDQNGGAGGSNGTTAADVSTLATLWGSVALGSPYRSRGDINLSGTINAGDLSMLLSQVGRLVLVGGVGCTSAICPGTGCP